jgi:hypothetical protein
MWDILLLNTNHLMQPLLLQTLSLKMKDAVRPFILCHKLQNEILSVNNNTQNCKNKD